MKYRQYGIIKRKSLPEVGFKIGDVIRLRHDADFLSADKYRNVAYRIIGKEGSRYYLEALSDGAVVKEFQAAYFLRHFEPDSFLTAAAGAIEDDK